MRLPQQQTLFFGRVIETEDPQKLGRIRVKLDPGEINSVYRIPEDKINDDGDDIQKKYKWTRYDPYIYLPLLPFFNKITPKKDEFVHIIFGNKDYPQQNKYYIPGVFSTPTSIGYQNFEDSKTYLSDGTNYKEEKSVQDKDPESNIKTDSYGVFPEPQDNAFLGRGTSDLILKDNTALLRAGKTDKVQRGELPVANNRRSYLELDYFTSQKETDERIQKKIIQEKSTKVVKYLIEYSIYNADNGQDAFTGDISVYKLKANALCNSDNLKQESNVEEFKPAPIYKIDFLGIPKSTLQNIINSFIKQFNDGFINLENYPVFRSKNLSGGQFPFFFRLGYKNYIDLYNETISAAAKTNLRDICKGINPFNVNTSGYTFYDLVSSKGKLGPSYEIKIEEYQETNYQDRPISYAVLGGDELFLISHKTEIPGKKRIEIDKATYGYTQDQIGIDIKDNTNSMVRGEKLIDFLNLVVKFLTSHVHSFPGMPPVPVAIDGTASQQILKEINEAYNTILNENIRIN